MTIPTQSPGKAVSLWGIAVVIFIGLFVGLGPFTFNYAEGLAYFSDDPEACLNCHVMRPQFEGWNHSSHKNVATCNTCHTPHSFPQKYIIKGINGWNHSFAFTTGNYPDPIRIRGFNADVVQANCVDCHRTLVSQIHSSAPGEERSCIACHGNVGHGK